MRWFKKILLILALGLVVIQFIRAEKNLSFVPPENNIAQQHIVPDGVDSVLKRSCYNCHSNNTDYPWYFQVQPVGWWLASHIRDGKSKLNFDEFAGYPLWRQHHKLEEIQEMIETDKMPLPSDLWLHRDEKLSAGEKSAVINWSIASRTAMEAKYPIDSLRQPPRPEGVPERR